MAPLGENIATTTTITDASGASLPSPPPLSRTKKNSPSALGDLLDLLIEESDVRLPPGYTALDRVGRQLASNPGRDKLVAELRARGFAAARCHLDARAFRTDARMVDILRACHMGLGIKIRPNSPFYDLVLHDN